MFALIDFTSEQVTTAAACSMVWPMLRPIAKFGFTFGLFACLGACASPPPAASPPAPSASPATPLVAAPQPATNAATVVDADAIVAAADRSDTDRALDAGRHPADLLRFFGVSAGQRVAELGTGGGYTSELLARAVGPSGKVFSQNSPFILQRFAEKPWSERLQKPVMANVVRVDREFDDPLPPEAKELDLVVNVLFYHDTVWQGTDRDRMNRAVFAALKSGGTYGIVDHSSRAGAALNDVKTLHRIEESVLKSEVEKAGFRLASEATFLKAPDDTRDWSTSPS